MPRTTAHKYLEHHRALRQLWISFPVTFTVLSPADQWRVHEYYQSQSAAPDNELLAARDRLRAEQPSLPQAAGNAPRFGHLAGIP